VVTVFVDLPVVVGVRWELRVPGHGPPGLKTCKKAATEAGRI
jgi:hypothetical protein